MKSDQMSLESLVEDGEWFCCPDIGVCSTTEAPEQRGVAARLSGLCLLSVMAVPAGQLMS